MRLSSNNNNLDYSKSRDTRWTAIILQMGRSNRGGTYLSSIFLFGWGKVIEPIYFTRASKAYHTEVAVRKNVEGINEAAKALQSLLACFSLHDFALFFHMESLFDGHGDIFDIPFPLI